MHDPSLCQPDGSLVCFASRLLKGHGLDVTVLHKQTAGQEWLLSGMMSSCQVVVAFRQHRC